MAVDLQFVSDVAWVTLASVGTLLACTLWTIHEGKEGKFTSDRPKIAFVSAFFSLVVAIAFLVASFLTDTTEGILTTKQWFGGGWDNGLSIFSVRIDTPAKYGALISYQICRSFLGSLLTNVFRSYLLVSIQGGKTNETDVDPSTIIIAQLCYDFFIFVSSIIDSMLVLSSVDLTMVTMVSTMVADGVTTFYFMKKKKLREMVGGTPLPEQIKQADNTKTHEISDAHGALRFRL